MARSKIIIPDKKIVRSRFIAQKKKEIGYTFGVIGCLTILVFLMMYIFVPLTQTVGKFAWTTFGGSTECLDPQNSPSPYCGDSEAFGWGMMVYITLMILIGIVYIFVKYNYELAYVKEWMIVNAKLIKKDEDGDEYMGKIEDRTWLKYKSTTERYNLFKKIEEAYGK